MAKKQVSGSIMSGTLRTAIKSCGETLYRVAKDSGVPYATLHRFMAHERAISMENLDKLCTYLGAHLTISREHGEQ